MNWDDLRIFLAVARLRTLSAAGQRLAIDPTTVARRLARLEADIGSSLFDSTPSGHHLTARGRDLIGHAESMESALLSGTGDANAGSNIRVAIRVSVSEGFGTWIIAPHLHRFASANPDIAVELVASTGFLNPSRREADIAVMLARPTRGPLVARKIADYRLGLFARKGASDLSKPTHLTQQKLIGYVTDLIYAPELNYLEEIAPGAANHLSSTSVNAQAMMVKSGAGIGILPCFIASSDPDLERLLPLEIDLCRSFWLVTHRDLRSASRVQRFARWLDQLIQEMQPMLDGRPPWHDQTRGYTRCLDGCAHGRCFVA